MKILYVEDELSRNIPRIMYLFSKYLSEESKNTLYKWEKDTSGFGATPEEIKRTVESTHVIDVEYSFSGALHKVLHNYQTYALCIVDRNLVETKYTLNDVKNVDSAYTKERYNEYFQREGDYLLHKLILDHKADVMTTFYFLTAYSAQDELRGHTDIEHYLNFGKFAEGNFIEKTNDVDLERLKYIVEHLKALQLRWENIRYVEILKEFLGDEAVERFLNVLATKDSSQEHDIINNLIILRNLFENILTNVAHFPNVPPQKVFKPQKSDGKEETSLRTTACINWLRGHSHEFDFNILLASFSSNLQNICSKYGIHKRFINAPGYTPTSNTINALVYELKEIMLWFNSLCKRA